MVSKELIKDYSYYTIFLPDTPEEPDSPFYIERYQMPRCSVEYECYEDIERPGSLVRIKAPNKMGKTSLINQIQARANEKNYISKGLNFDMLTEPSNVSSVNNFLKAFNKNLKGLFPNVPEKSDWDDNNPKISCTKDLKVLLLNLQKNLVLIFDEVDKIFEYPEITKAFCGMLRYWHEESKTVEVWKKLRIVIAYSTEYYGTLDIYQSPFNVGLQIQLKEFTEKEVTKLICSHQLDPKIVNDLMSMVGGHPYLIRLALYKISQSEDENSDYYRLIFGFFGAVNPGNLIRDIKQLSFNIGCGIELNELRFEDAKERLIKGLEGRFDEPEEILKKVFAWSGGQPFLTQKICQLIVNYAETNQPDVDSLI